LTGNSSSDIVSKIYRNDGGNTFIELTNVTLLAVWTGSSIWGDYDSDGDLDLLVSGHDGSQSFSKIYRNLGNDTFTEQTDILLPGISGGSVAWGDYDNDGDLDILLAGSTGSESISKIFRNDGNNIFTEQSEIIFPGVSNSSVDWGDYDNDGDLDVLLSGLYGPARISKIFRNNTEQVNTSPTVPQNLYTVVSGQHVEFHWDRSTDAQDSQAGLSYNIAIGSTPGGCDILAPHANVSTGYRER